MLMSYTSLNKKSKKKIENMKTKKAYFLCVCVLRSKKAYLLLGNNFSLYPSDWLSNNTGGTEHLTVQYLLSVSPEIVPHYL